MINAKDMGEVLSFILGGIILSIIFKTINPMIAGFIVATIMVITKTCLGKVTMTKANKNQTMKTS